jgi:hypothetical protein
VVWVWENPAIPRGNITYVAVTCQRAGLVSKHVVIVGIRDWKRINIAGGGRRRVAAGVHPAPAKIEIVMFVVQPRGDVCGGHVV